MSSFSLGGPPFLSSGAYGHGWRVLGAGAQGPAVRVVGEDDAIGAQLVDQDCDVGRAGHLGGTAARAARFPDKPGPRTSSGRSGRSPSTGTFPPTGLSWCRSPVSPRPRSPRSRPKADG